MKQCKDCRYLRQDIKDFATSQVTRVYGGHTSPCNRYPRNILRSPKEPACGEFKEKE